MLLKRISVISSLRKALSNIQGKDITSHLKDPSTYSTIASYHGDTLPNDLLHDYSHLLPDKHREQGYKLYVYTPTYETKQTSMPWTNTSHVSALLINKDNKIRGHVNVFNKNGTANPHSNLALSLRGQGLGLAMYEAALGHAKKYHGINKVAGEASYDAINIHNKIINKHGYKFNDVSKKPITILRNYEYNID